MPHGEHQHGQALVLELADQPVVAHPVAQAARQLPLSGLPYRRGSSTTRSRRKRRMRAWTGGSSFLSCLEALVRSSTVQAKIPLQLLKADGSLLAPLVALVGPFGLLGLRQLVQVFGDGLPD